MNFTINLFHCIKTLGRNFCTGTLIQEIKVKTFCDINVNVPYNIQIKPLDVHKESDKLQIELVGRDISRRSIKHIQNGNDIKILSNDKKFDANVTCSLKVPIKANLNVTTDGNISAGFFNGSQMILKSTNGDIFVEKYNGDQLDLETEVGNIVLKGAVVATNIKAQIWRNGSIKTKRLQGLSAFLKTNSGDITVDAAYCDNSVFEAKFGKVELQNIHKNNRIEVEKCSLTLNGLDGKLEALLRHSDADIQISRILENSKIVMEQNGELILRLSEECQENTMFEITAKKHELDQSIKTIPSTTGNCLYLTPTTQDFKQVIVQSDGLVRIKSASWMSMLKLNVK